MGTHAPATQLVVPCAFVQVLPHAPQLVVLTWMFVSHPFAVLPSQSANPALHVGTQTPAEHAVLPLAFEHAFPQAPQLAVFVFRFASHPFAGSPSQLANPELQLGVHVPAEHAVVPLALVHAFPHVPQFPRLD